MQYLVVIPARGGSKGVLKKNIKELDGKPLIQYTLEAARSVFNDDEICVSTDSLEIKKVVESIGLKVPFLRPKNLATDSSSTYDVLLHALDYHNKLGYFPSVVVLLQVTSPFRTGKHIEEALALYTADLDMVVSVKETQSNPYYVLFEETKEGWLKKSKNAAFTRRQDCPKVWEYNGAVYVINTKTLIDKPLHLFEKIKKYEMDEESSLDIDTPLDWKIAKTIIDSSK
tara:strand:- start:7454 stop:8137 length:684 start_codon:yes stop_codon:yes gene_type:complete